MSKLYTEFQISDLAAWTTIADLQGLIKKRDAIYLALAWGDQDVVNGRAPPYQAGFETATDLENARRAFGLSARYDIDGILTQNTALFDVKRGSPETVRLIGLKQSVDLGERNWFHTISEIHDFRSGKTCLEKDTLGLGKIRLSHIKIASSATNGLCEELHQLGREIEAGKTDNDGYRRASTWVDRIAIGHEDENVRQTFVGVRDELKTAKTREEFSAAAIHFVTAVSMYRAAAEEKSTASLNETIKDLNPTRSEVNRLRQVFPIGLEHGIATPDSSRMICEQIAKIKKLARGEWLLQKPIQHAYQSTGIVHPDPEISLITNLAVYADYAKKRGIEGAEPAAAVARTLAGKLMESTL